MYLHLGGDYLIKKEKIIAVFDLDTAMNNTTSQKFLKKIKSKNHVTYVSVESKEKTLVITSDGNYISPISSLTLLKRSNNAELLDD